MLTQREMDVLEILWKTGEPQIGADIAGFDPKLGLTQSTVTAVLRTLLNRGLVEVADIRKSGKVLSRAFSPTQQAKEEVLDAFAEMYNAVKSGVTVKEVTGRLRTCK